MLIGLCVEDYHAVAGIVQAGCKFGPVRRIGHTQDSAVDVQGRLAYEVASRPLLAEDLHAEAATAAKIIARCGEFVATWGPIDAPDFAVDAQGR